MATKKAGPKAERETIGKVLAEFKQEIKEKSKGGPRLSKAALTLLSPNVRKMVEEDYAKKNEKAEYTFTPEDVGLKVIAFFRGDTV